jgi:hypothetical protein
LDAGVSRDLLSGRSDIGDFKNLKQSLEPIGGKTSDEAFMKQELKAAGGAIERAVHELVLANDGAWTWFNDPRALFHNGRLYFGYVKRGTTRPALSVYDPETGQHFALAERKIRPLHRLSHQGHRALCGIIL